MVATTIQNLLNYLDRIVPLETILPFFLIFIVFWIAGKAAFTKRGTAADPIAEKHGERIAVIVSLILSLTITIPHILHKYPAKVDPILMINNAIPSIGMMAVAIVFLMIILGVIGLDRGNPKFVFGAITILSIILVVYLFAGSLFPDFRLFAWLRRVPTEIISLAVVIFVMVILINLITGKKTDWKAKGKGAREFLEKFGP